MKIVGYTRVSKDRPNGFSLSQQEHRIGSWASSQGHQVIEVCVDNGLSGAKDESERPGLRKALDLLEDGEAQMLVVAKLDRLSRSVFDFTRLLERFREMDFELAALDLGVDTTTPVGELTANVLISIAQFERRQVAERLHSGRREKARQGGYVGGPMRYGLASEDEMEAIELARRLRAEGMTLQFIADALTEAGFKPRRGATWYPTTVSRLLGRS